jgi:hypothetical protein
VKAIVLGDYGKVNHLSWENVAPPGSDVREAVIRNQMANYFAIDLRRGLFGVISTLPHVMGADSSARHLYRMRDRMRAATVDDEPESFLRRDIRSGSSRPAAACAPIARCNVAHGCGARSIKSTRSCSIHQVFLQGEP